MMVVATVMEMFPANQWVSLWIFVWFPYEFHLLGPPPPLRGPGAPQRPHQDVLATHRSDHEARGHPEVRAVAE